MVYICEIVTKFINTDELPYASALMLAIVVLLVSLIVSYFVIKLIRYTFLKILIISPKKKEVK